MDKLILGVLALGLVLGVTYAINFHFDDFLFWLADSGSADSAKDSQSSLGPFSKGSGYASFK